MHSSAAADRPKWTSPSVPGESIPSIQPSLTSLGSLTSRAIPMPRSDILRVKTHRQQAEISVQLMANRIAMLKAEKERAQRRIKAMNTTVEKVQRCQRAEMELKKQFEESKQLLQKKIEETAARVKQQTIQARQNLRLKLDEELRLKQMMVKEERERSVQMRSCRDQAVSFPEQTVEGVRKMKEQLKKRKQETEERLRQKLDRKREQRLKAELLKRNEAEKRLVQMAEQEQKMLESLFEARNIQKKVYARYEKLFRQ